LSKVNRRDGPYRPNWQYPARKSAETADVDLLEMTESVRNVLELILTELQTSRAHILGKLDALTAESRALHKRLARAEGRYLRERREQRKHG
jgi:hypothetical protein